MNFLRDRYKTGLDKIQETNVVIDEMQQTLTELEPELKEKSAATEALMIKLDKDKDEANAVREVVSEDERVANIKATETKAIKDDAQSLGWKIYISFLKLILMSLILFYDFFP